MSSSVTGSNTQTTTVSDRSIKEIVTAAISVSIGAIALIMLIYLFVYAGDEKFSVDVFNRKKDILAVALSLFGTVTGYYLGRVPAEKQADAARKQADAAGSLANIEIQKKNQIKNLVSTAAAQAQEQDLAGGGSPDQVQKILRNLENQIRHI